MKQVNVEEVSGLFDALSNKQRLSIYLYLVKEHKKYNIKELQSIFNIKPSTLAHHIKTLVDTGLIVQEKSGKEVLNMAKTEKIKESLELIIAICCSGEEVEICDCINI